MALDGLGNLAAATSTGGMTAKAGSGRRLAGDRRGQLGGRRLRLFGHRYGEYFIRCAVGHEVSARLRWAGHSLEDAARAVICQDLAALGGSGGLVAVDRHGNIALPFNCAGMYRGFAKLGAGTLHTAIYADDERVVPV